MDFFADLMETVNRQSARQGEGRAPSRPRAALASGDRRNSLCAKRSGRPLAIDLFAGCGGLSLGFEQAGFDIVAAVEIDPIHAAVHEYNFPYTKTICADIKNVTGADIRKMADLGDRDVDVVFGGAPCQGFSMIGKRALDDPRNQLIGHYLSCAPLTSRCLVLT